MMIPRDDDDDGLGALRNLIFDKVVVEMEMMHVVLVLYGWREKTRWRWCVDWCLYGNTILQRKKEGRGKER